MRQSLIDAVSDAAAAWYDEYFQPEPERRTHFVLVGFSGTDMDAYASPLLLAAQEVNAWFRRFGLELTSFDVQLARLSGGPADYDFWKLINTLHLKGLLTMDGKNAWYLFIAEKLPWPIGGTIGGDMFGQKGGQEEERVPGLSFADHACVYALKHNAPPAEMTFQLTRNIVKGWVAHELMHNLALLPCRCGHAADCIMSSGCYNFPDCVLGCANPKVWHPDGPVPGDEIKACLQYGFLKRL